MINIKELRVDYDGVTAVQELNLHVEAGQIYGLVGPNGAGKTSTIKALAGIIQPTYGHIKIAGIDLDLHPSKALKHLGYMPDFSPVYEDLLVWEYLDVFAAAYLIPRKERLKHVMTWLDRVNLMDKKNALIRNLSRGMKQRLVLAKTLLHNPDVILLDEPASGLDPMARKEMRTILLDVARDNKTIIISSHILSELSDFCNAIGIMEKGRMVVSGSLHEIRSRLGGGKKLNIILDKHPESLNKKFLAFINNSNNLTNIFQKTPDHCVIDFKGTAQDCSWILAQLIKLEIPIIQYYLEEDSVEDLFFKIGAKETA